MPKYTEEQKQWLIENYRNYREYEDITEDFNKAFQLCKSKNAISILMRKTLKITLETEKMSHHFTKEQEKWIVDNFERFSTYKELAHEFNKIFGRDKSVEAIREKCNKNLGLNGMENTTRFRKGNEKEQCPIGTIRKTSNGVTYIKVKDSRLSFQKGYREPYWLPIQKKIWQDNYGEAPKGKMIVFLDGNHENLDIENLYCIDRKISVIMAKNRWFTESREHTLTAIKWCELFYAMKSETE